MEMNNAYEQLLNNTAETIIENNIEDVYMGDAQIIPVNANILAEPYVRNPYRYIETTESGLIVGIESSKTYKSNETGEIEKNNELVRCAKVLEVGPDCKNVKVGDDIFFTAFEELKLPFRKKGWIMVSETRIICRIVRKNNENGKF